MGGAFFLCSQRKAPVLWTAAVFAAFSPSGATPRTASSLVRERRRSPQCTVLALRARALRAGTEEQDDSASDDPGDQCQAERAIAQEHFFRAATQFANVDQIKITK